LILGGVLSFFILSFSLPFSLVCYFLCLLVALQFFVVDDFLELFLPFWFYSCASWGFRFELQTLCIFVVNGLIKGEIEKPSGQFLALIVMNH
jgi:hypothetical protein